MAVTARGRTVTILRACACPATCLWPPSNRLCRLQSKLTALSFPSLFLELQRVHKNVKMFAFFSKNVSLFLCVLITSSNMNSALFSGFLCVIWMKVLSGLLKKKYPHFNNIFLARSLNKKILQHSLLHLSLAPTLYSIRAGPSP